MATAPFPRNSSCFICLASKLSFSDLAPKTERLIMEPSLVTTVAKQRSFGNSTKFDPEPSSMPNGWRFRAHAVDLTINPDFSQVEADSPQLTANSAAINLPEKGASSRRIGPHRTVLPILYTEPSPRPIMASGSLSVRPASTGLPPRQGRRARAHHRTRPLSSSGATPDFAFKVGFARNGRWIALIGALGAARTNDDGSYNALGRLMTWQIRLTG